MIHKIGLQFDYQLDRHCSKTAFEYYNSIAWFDYQLDRHCSKTVYVPDKVVETFDYQLDRHCSKTVGELVGQQA